MKCPLCKSREHVEIDLHADGFSQDVRECGDCGAIWTFSGNTLKLIKESTQGASQQAIKYAAFTCPTCKSSNSIETDLDAFQFHEELYECTECGTTSSNAHNQIEVVRDAQPGSFLSSTTEPVEADDYVFV